VGATEHCLAYRGAKSRLTFSRISDPGRDRRRHHHLNSKTAQWTSSRRPAGRLLFHQLAVPLSLLYTSDSFLRHAYDQEEILSSLEKGREKMVDTQDPAPRWMGIPMKHVSLVTVCAARGATGERWLRHRGNWPPWL